MNSKIQSKQNERGQSMVELALAITVLMVLLAGTIDLGRALFTWQAMRNAAQEGASYGSIVPPSGPVTCSNLTLPPYPQICRRVYDNLKQVITDPYADALILVSLPDGDNSIGSAIQVDVYDPKFPLTMPFLGTILGSQTINLHAKIIDSIIK